MPNCLRRTVAALTAQARLQTAPRIDGKPPFEVTDTQPLNLLPDPDKGDLFFDFEGDPLWTADGRDWGLEYLFGVVEVGGAFRPLWAHDRESERQALVDFLAMVRKRRKRYPNMHIYHYAAYEKTALLRLAGRYGVGEDEVDDLLRNGVLVDLFPVGAQEHSGRHRELQPQVARAALHGRGAAHRRRHHRRRLDQRVRPLLRTARRRPRLTRPRSCSRRSRSTTATTADRRTGCATG